MTESGNDDCCRRVVTDFMYIYVTKYNTTPEQQQKKRMKGEAISVDGVLLFTTNAPTIVTIV